MWRTNEDNIVGTERPLRGENRKSVGDKQEYYPIERESFDESSARRGFQYRTVRCSLCGTDMVVTKADVGKEIVCPDCGTKTVVSSLDFNKETQYEREYYNEAKRERDKLYSPLRNPNRVGVRIDEREVYASKGDSFDETDARRSFRYRTISCPRCGTSLSVSKRDVGKSVACPDCELIIKVPELDFDKETDYERQYFNEEKRERDELYSPLRNPNRVGIPVNEKDVYRLSLGNEEVSHSAREQSPAFYPIRCRVCETLIQVPSEMLGKTFVCPDCGTRNVVTNALKEQQDAINVRFQPRDRGIYDIGEVPEAPSVAFQQTNGKTVIIDPSRKTIAPSAPKIPQSRKDLDLSEFNVPVASMDSVDAVAQSNVSTQRESTSTKDTSSADAVKTRRTKKRSNSRARKNASQEDPNEYLPPLVPRTKNGQTVWAQASPPRFAPLFNGTFSAVCSGEIWIRGIINVLGIILLAFLFWGTELKGGEVGGIPGMGDFISLFSTVGLFLTSFAVIAVVGLYFWSCFNSGNSGARRIIDWRSEDVFGFFGFGVWFLCMVLAPVAFGIGLDYALAQASISIPKAALYSGVFWILFPIFWISTNQADAFFFPITWGVFMSFISKFFSWIAFYLFSAIFFALPCSFLLAGIDKPVVQLLSALFFLLVPMIYGLLLGRLSWIIDDEIRSLDYDD